VIQSRDRPARSESLYLLSNPGLHFVKRTNYKGLRCITVELSPYLLSHDMPVRIMTGYGFHCRRVVVRFLVARSNYYLPENLQTSLGRIHPLIQQVSRDTFRGGLGCQVVNLTTQVHVIPRLRIIGVTPSMACIVIALPLLTSCVFRRHSRSIILCTYSCTTSSEIVVLCE